MVRAEDGIVGGGEEGGKGKEEGKRDGKEGIEGREGIGAWLWLGRPAPELEDASEDGAKAIEGDVNNANTNTEPKKGRRTRESPRGRGSSAPLCSRQGQGRVEAGVRFKALGWGGGRAGVEAEGRGLGGRGCGGQGGEADGGGVGWAVGDGWIPWGRWWSWGRVRGGVREV